MGSQKKRRRMTTDTTTNRSFRITVRFSPWQQRIIEDMCQRNGCDSSTVIRAGIELLERMSQRQLE